MQDSLHTIVEALRRDYILAEGVHAGDRLPAVRELVARYNASATTVVNALSVLQREGVVLKLSRVGVFVADYVKPSTQVRRLGLVVQMDGAELSVLSQSGVQVACQAKGWSLEVSSSANRLDTERQILHRMAKSGCEAIVVYPALRTADELRNDYLSRELRDHAIVLVDVAYREQKRPSVVFDNYHAGYDMTMRLIKKGHVRIAFQRCGMTPTDPMLKSNVDRYQGYLDALKQNGLAVSENAEISFSTWDQQDAHLFERIMKRWMMNPNRPTVIIALADYWAMMLADQAKAFGIRVPEDFEVVGFDNSQIGVNPTFPMLTSHADFSRAGQIAAEMAMSLANGTILDSERYMMPAPIDYWHRVEPAVTGNFEFVSSHS